MWKKYHYLCTEFLTSQASFIKTLTHESDVGEVQIGVPIAYGNNKSIFVIY